MISSSAYVLIPTVTAELFLVCMAGQVLHGWLRLMHSKMHKRPLVIVYEGMLLVYLLFMSLFAIDLSRETTNASARLVEQTMEFSFSIHSLAQFVPLSFHLLFWLHVIVAIVFAVVSFSSLEGAGEPEESTSWMPSVEALLACVCAIALLMSGGGMWPIVLPANVMYYAFRTIYLLFWDRRNRSLIVSPLSVVEALKRFPEGIMYADAKGVCIDANTTMRRLLSALGLSPDSANVEALHERLKERAIRLAGAVAPEDIAREYVASDSHVAEPQESESPETESHAAGSQAVENKVEAWIIARVDSDEAWLFTLEELGHEQHRRYPAARPLGTEQQLELARRVFGTTPRIRVLAYDVSAEVELITEIERTNAELEASHRQLRASAEATRAAAENEAMLKMRGRVHDVIGQRLSLLHRALEDNAVSDEALEQMKPLLKGILDDLSADTRVSPADDLAATVDAFALSGITVDVVGELPADEQRAELFANCVREAVTNAVKHARARRVKVIMDENTLEVSNDGMLPAWPITEGTGLTHMRHAIESAGGTLDITPSPFTIHIQL